MNRKILDNERIKTRMSAEPDFIFIVHGRLRGKDEKRTNRRNGNRKRKYLGVGVRGVLLAKNAQELKEMMGRLKTYLEKRNLTLNTGKSKVFIFKKGRRQKKKEEWK